jgi:hypothetical protein
MQFHLFFEPKSSSPFRKKELGGTLPRTVHRRPFSPNSWLGVGKLITGLENSEWQKHSVAFMIRHIDPISPL